MQPNSPALQLIQTNDAARAKTTAQLEQDVLANAAPFPVRSIGEVLADPELSRPPQWVVQTLFVLASLNVVYGAGKLGKSTLLGHLAVAVALGKRFAGLWTKQGRVLWIDLEQGYSRWTRSLKAVPGIDTPDLPLDVFSSLGPEGRSLASLAATLKNGHYGLVIIDSLGKFAQIEDENDNAGWQRVLQALEELARNGTAAIVFIDHDRKGEGEHGRGLRGASSKLAAMDTAVHLKRAQKGPDTARRLEIVSRESGTFSLDLTLTDDGYTTTAQTVDIVEQALRGTGPMSMDVLLTHLQREGFSLARSTIQARLSALIDAGKVTTDGSGRRNDPKVFSVVADSADSATGTNWQSDTMGAE